MKQINKHNSHKELTIFINNKIFSQVIMNFILIFILTVIASGNLAFADTESIIWKRDDGFGLINKMFLTSDYGTCDKDYFECS